MKRPSAPPPPPGSGAVSSGQPPAKAGACTTLRCPQQPTQPRGSPQTPSHPQQTPSQQPPGPSRTSWTHTMYTTGSWATPSRLWATSVCTRTSPDGSGSEGPPAVFGDEVTCVQTSPDAGAFLLRLSKLKFPKSWSTLVHTVTPRAFTEHSRGLRLMAWSLRSLQTSAGGFHPVRGLSAWQR